jgi:hypothetical protein
MANLGNAWHIPGNPEPAGRAGMRNPVGAIVPGTAVTIITGNQFRGAGNPGNQLQTGSALFFKRAADATWALLPLIFLEHPNGARRAGGAGAEVSAPRARTGSTWSSAGSRCSPRSDSGAHPPQPPRPRGGHRPRPDHVQRSPKRFVWTKTADALLASVSRHCHRISDSGHQTPSRRRPRIRLGAAARPGAGHRTSLGPDPDAEQPAVQAQCHLGAAQGLDRGVNLRRRNLRPALRGQLS